MKIKKIHNDCTIIFLFLFLFVGTQLALSQDFPPIVGEPEMPLDELQMPGSVEGTGAHFEVMDSEYLNITLDSTEEISVTLESIPEMVTIHVESASGATSTVIVLVGFAPDTTYYKYEDDYHNLVVITTDRSGSYSYVQDISAPHLLFIQSQPSTRFIPSDTEIGTWDSINRVYTLTTDLNETIQVDEDTLTLDGAGHTVTGTSTGYGVYLYGRTGVTIRNLNVQAFSRGIYLVLSNDNIVEDNTVLSHEYFGISLNHSSNNTLRDNTASGNGCDCPNLWQGCAGINLAYASKNIVEGNTLSNNYHGILLWYSSHNNTIKSNTAESNNRGIGVDRSNYNNVTSNTVSNNNYGIVVGTYANNNVVEGNTLSSNITSGIYLGDTTHSNILTGNTAESHSGWGGIYLWYSNNNILTGNTASNNVNGILLFYSNNNILTDNTVKSNGFYGIYLGGSNDNQIYNNNLISNRIHAYVSTGNGNVFNLPAPVGGNYWSDWTSPDADGDGSVDYPYVFTGGQDDLPWTYQNGWLDPAAAITALIATIESMNLQQGIENSLDAKLDNALDALDAANAGNRNDAINKLGAFINAVEAQRGKALTDAQANQLVALANNIISALGGTNAAPALVRVTPSESQLTQNYPNPFNPETWIPYRLKEDANVVISIRSATGQLVRTFNLGHRKAGVYTSMEKAVHWDGRNQYGEKTSSGIYFYTIQAGAFTATKKMIIAE